MTGGRPWTDENTQQKDVTQRANCDAAEQDDQLHQRRELLQVADDRLQRPKPNTRLPRLPSHVRVCQAPALQGACDDAGRTASSTPPLKQLMLQPRAACRKGGRPTERTHTCQRCSLAASKPLAASGSLVASKCLITHSSVEFVIQRTAQCAEQPLRLFKRKVCGGQQGVFQLSAAAVEPLPVC